MSTDNSGQSVKPANRKEEQQLIDYSTYGPAGPDSDSLGVDTVKIQSDVTLDVHGENRSDVDQPVEWFASDEAMLFFWRPAADATP